MIERRGQTVPATSLVDILDRVLDKGLVVAGDIRIALANVELLTIQIRLLVCSIDKAEEIGLDWWRRDRFFGGAAEALETTAELRARVEALERQLAAPPPPPGRTTRRAGRARSARSERPS